ncbi:MAG TPA: metal-dependent hydrolase [Candidatus Methylomirabilis sp.]
MDPVTHTLTGVLVAEAGFRRRLGPAAAVALAVAAEAPDVDYALRLMGRTVYLAHHRGLTHSVLMAPALAGLVAAACLPLSRERRFAPLFGVALLGVCMHIFEDLVTPFGTMLLAPLSWHRFSLDWFFIIDPYFSGMLLAALLTAWAWRRRALLVSRAGVAALAAYLALTGVLHAAALARVDRLAAHQGWPGTATAAFPLPGSPFAWNGVVATPGASYQILFSLWDGVPPVARRYPAVALDGPLRAAEEAPLVALFRWFARFPVIEVHDTGAGPVVELYDLRFQYPSRRTPFRVRVQLDGDGRVLKSGWAR